MGACAVGAADKAENVNIYALQFDGKPEVACGNGWFSSYCIDSYDNCITTEFGIICDHDYLWRLNLLASAIVSIHQSNPFRYSPVPTDVMWHIARLVQLSKERVYGKEGTAPSARLNGGELSW